MTPVHPKGTGTADENFYPQHYPQRPPPPSLADHLANEIGQRAARCLVNLAEDSFWYGCGKVADTYRYFVPLTAEQMLARAMFGRREVDGFIKKAIALNELSMVLPAHRISDVLRHSLVRDGYTVNETTKDGIPALRIGFAPRKMLPAPDPPKPVPKSG